MGNGNDPASVTDADRAGMQAAAEAALAANGNVDINAMSVTELKVLAYDQMVVLEQTQNNLRLINERIGQLQKG